MTMQQFPRHLVDPLPQIRRKRQRLGSGNRGEIGVAQLEGQRASLNALFSQPLSHPIAQIQQAPIHLLLIAHVPGEGSLVPYGLGLMAGFHRAVIDPQGMRPEGFPLTPKFSLQETCRAPRQLANGRYAHGTQPASRDWTDAPQPLDGQGSQKRRFRPGGHHHEPLRFAIVRGDLGHQLAGGQPDRSGKAQLTLNPTLYLSGQLLGRAPQKFAPGDIQKRLIDGDGLH